MNKRNIGLILGTTGAVVGIAVGLTAAFKTVGRAAAGEPFLARLDTNGPCVLASTQAAAAAYGDALAEARKLHPGAFELVFLPGDLAKVLAFFRTNQPRYALVFILPGELDVNFAWEWLRVTTQADDDPLVDVRTGFVTGDSPATAASFVRRIRAAVENRTPLPGLAVDNLGPNLMAPGTAFHQTPGNFMIPVLGARMGLSTISHGTNAFTSGRLGCLDDAGLVHFGGHGYPDRVVDGATCDLIRQVKLKPCVIFNGACYTGVTGRWFDMQGGITERQVAPEKSFCLALLANDVLGYLAALHPDHGIPVYQEMEFLATDGPPLGDLIKHTHDGVILASEGALPKLDPFTNGMPHPRWTPSDVMLKGTASRVLFGDPALILTPAFAAPAFDITPRIEDTNTLRVTAVLKNKDLKSTFTDTYHADLASNPNLFNDRALITVKLPAGWESARAVKVLRAEAKSKPLQNRLVGFAVEKDANNRLLHVQVDLPTSGYMQSEFRTAGACVELEVHR